VEKTNNLFQAHSIYIGKEKERKEMLLFACGIDANKKKSVQHASCMHLPPQSLKHGHNKSHHLLMQCASHCQSKAGPNSP
jgi:hypothetical protein